MSLSDLGRDDRQKLIVTYSQYIFLINLFLQAIISQTFH